MQTHSNIPHGFCHCGCGQKTSIINFTVRRLGYIKGEPYKFIRGHHTVEMSPVERLWSKIDKRGPDECWPFIGFKDSKGYGRLRFDRRTKNITLAHRAAWESVNGPIPDDMCVLHRCDNPSCCNPAHHFLGTKADNVADMDQKGRRAAGERQNLSVGEQHYAVKLTEQDVIDIRVLWATGKANQLSIARLYNVSRSNISAIVTRKSWKHVYP